MKYKVITLKDNKSVLVDETADSVDIKLDDHYVAWEDNYETPQWVVYVLVSKTNGKTPYKVVATINHSINKNIPMIIVEDEVEKLANEANGYLFNNPKPLNPNGSKALAFDEGFKKGYKAAQKNFYSEKDLEKAYEAGEDSKEDEINGDGESLFSEYLHSLNQKYIELETVEYTDWIERDGGRNVIPIVALKFKTTIDENGQLIAYIKQ